MHYRVTRALARLAGLGPRNGGKSSTGKSTVYREPHFHFDTSFLELPPGTYIDGYWQSERYFKHIAETIFEECAVRTPLEGRNSEMASAIRAEPSVAIHVRRGDYATDAGIASVHGLCSPEYYLAAVETVRSKVAHPHFFVFSDEPDWARQNFEFCSPVTIIDHNDGSQAHEDLRLMSLCDHTIIANSSFSWWGAWLNSNPGKTVIAPDRWFRDPAVDTSELLPEDWIRLGSTVHPGPATGG